MTKTLLGLFIALALAGCTSSVGDGDIASSEEALALEASDALQLAGILGYELSGLVTDPGSLGEDGSETDPIPGPSGAEPVGSGDCTDVGWEPDNLFGVTLEFDNCVLDNGDVLHGAVGISALGGDRGTVHVDFDDLAIGDRFVTGTMTLSTSGTDIQIDADLQYIDSDTNMGITLEGLRMSVRANGVHFIGRGTVTQSGERWMVSIDNVLWSGASLCHPSEGSIDLTQTGQPPITVVFSPGSVTVQVGMEQPRTIESGC